MTETTDHSRDDTRQGRRTSGAASTNNGFGSNALYSGAAWVVPTAIAVVAVPVTIRGLGADGYGVVALVGAVAGYLGLLDLGLSQGIVRFLAMFVSKKQGTTARECVRLVLGWFLGVGVLGAVVMWVLAPWLAGSLLKVPSDQVSLATDAFRIGGLSFALGMVAGVLSFIPEAFLRYDLKSLINGALSSANFAGPALLVLLGYGVRPVLLFYMVMNGVAIVCWALVGARLLSGLPRGGPPFGQYRRDFLGFTSTVAVNRIWGAIQSETSKVVIGAAGGLAQVGFFQVPNLITTRARGLLNAMSTVVLPTGSQLVAEGEHDLLIALYAKSSRLFYVLNASMTAAIVVFAGPLLTHWVGPQYGTEGGLAFMFLALASGVNTTTHTASGINLSMGRPKVNLAFSMINTFINLATVYLFTIWWGIAGTAASGLLAAAIAPFFLHFTHRKVLGVSSREIFRTCYGRATVAVGLVATIAWFVLRPLASSLVLTLGLVVATGAAGLLASAAFGALTRAELTALRSRLRLRPPRRGGTPGGEGE